MRTYREQSAVSRGSWGAVGRRVTTGNFEFPVRTRNSLFFCRHSLFLQKIPCSLGQGILPQVFESNRKLSAKNDIAGSNVRNSLYFPCYQGIWPSETGSRPPASSANQSGRHRYLRVGPRNPRGFAPTRGVWLSLRVSDRVKKLPFRRPVSATIFRRLVFLAN